MTQQQILDYCLNKNCAYLDYPFGDDVMVVKKTILFLREYGCQSTLPTMLQSNFMRNSGFRQQVKLMMVKS